MARPKKSTIERRIVNLPSARCTEEDKQEIERAANAAKLSVSEFIVRAAKGAKITVRKSKTDAQLLYELNAIGNNLNQLARKFNQTGSVPPDLHDLLKFIQTYVLKRLPE